MVIKYINAYNNALDLNEKPLKFGGGDLFDYEWTPVSVANRYGARVKQFGREAKTITFSVYLSGTDEQKKKALNQIVEICDTDVVTESEGTLYFNEYHIGCFLVDVSVEPTVKVGGDTKAVLKFYCPNPFWIKENKQYFFDYDTVAGDGGLDFPYDYAHDYGTSSSAQVLDNPNYTDSDVEIEFNGPCQDPFVIINGHLYKVYFSANNNEKIVINTMENTIKHLNNIGIETNIFNYRDRDSDVFEKVPAGINSVYWNGGYNFSITVFEKRSDPKWT